jgi:DNA-directed RNA polymerase subunit RPC12/RpoP
MPVVATTAEWICTRCGSTNRQLVPATSRETVDRCVSCHARHVVKVGTRPVRWDARLKD